jgi:hypothetical protein
MKTNPTKFARLPKMPKMFLGGLFGATGFLGASGGLSKFAETAGGKAAMGIGSGLLGSASSKTASPGLAIAPPVAGNLGQSEVSAANTIDLTGAANQNVTNAKNSRNATFGAIDSLGDAGIISGFAPAIVGGLVVKGLSALGKALGIGKGSEEEAERKKRIMETTSAQASVAKQGAVNRNSIQTFKAPAYGRRGMKLRTSKFSKPC